jgi:membrane-bound lytic murein transglycosylase B
MLRALFLSSALAAAGFGLTMSCAGPLGGPPQSTEAAAQAPPAPIAPLTFASSGDPAFDAWRADFAQRALAAGRQRAVVFSLLGGLTPDPRIITLDQNQAEFVRPVWDYIDRAVSARRIEDGRERIAALRAVFEAVQARFGVDYSVIAGIWAIETNFGAAALPHSAPRAIATLAAEGRRRETFERYMLSLIEMVEKGFAGPQEMASSWAGAMGQPQFMPDVYLQLAVDFDGDGRRDIWSNPGDIFASVANYLSAKGWVRDQPVFDEVRLPAGFDYALADGVQRPIEAWRQLGVQTVTGAALPIAVGIAQLYLPAGHQGPALLLYPNFGAIRAYNPSDRYALAVALLARGFKGEAGLRAPWPREIGALDRAQTLQLQEGLTALGYPTGGVDGMFGANTRRAVRAYQQAKALPADGYPTPALLARVTAESRGETAQGLAVDTHGASTLLMPDGLRQLQRAFNRAGYAAGAADGRIGPATRTAVRRLERRLGLPETGRPTDFILAEALKLPQAPPPPRRAPPKRKKRR